MAEAGDTRKEMRFDRFLSQSPLLRTPLLRGVPPTLYRLSFRLMTPVVEVDP